MKTNVLKALKPYLTCVVMVTLLLPAWSSVSGQENAKLKSTIEAMNNKFVDAFRSGNADGLAAFYTTDGQLMFPGSPTLSGVDQITAYWKGAISAGVNNVKLETTDVSGCGDQVIEYGTYTIFAGDNFTVDKGKYIVIWKKEGNQLKIFRDISNSDNPPPIARSVENDTILIIHNYVKADKVADFKKYNYDLVRIARKENSPAARSARMLEPLRANEDGTFTFIYLMDPAISTPDAYKMLPPLIREYGEEKARDILKAGFTDALARPQVSSRYVVREMGK